MYSKRKFVRRESSSLSSLLRKASSSSAAGMASSTTVTGMVSGEGAGASAMDGASGMHHRFASGVVHPKQIDDTKLVDMKGGSGGGGGGGEEVSSARRMSREDMFAGKQVSSSSRSASATASYTLERAQR